MRNINSEQFRQWLKTKGLKERTVQEYTYYFDKFDFQTFEQKTVAKFLENSSHQNTAARCALKNLRLFLITNYDDLNLGYPKDKILSVEFPRMTGRKKVRIPKPLLIKNILSLEPHLPTEKEKLQLLLSLHGALRIGEMLKLQVLSFDWEAWKAKPEEPGEARVFGKGDKEGIAIFPSWLMKRVARYIHEKEFPHTKCYLFLPNNREKVSIKTHSRYWQRIFLKAGEDAGIVQRDSQGNIIKETRIWPHLLRHSAITDWILQKGLDLTEAKEGARHADISSTQIYTHISKEHLKKKMYG